MRESPIVAFINIEDLRVAARRRLPRAVFDYIDGGADAEITLRENCRAFEQVTLPPRSAVAPPACDPGTTGRGPARSGGGGQGVCPVDPVGHASGRREGGHDGSRLVSGLPRRWA